MKRVIYIFLLCTVSIYAQGTAGASASIESTSIIDMPTAGVLKKGDVGVGIYLMPDGVTISSINAGIFENFEIGISYGASNFIGVGAPEWYKLPGVSLKIKVFDESLASPAIAVGFISQGKGKYYSWFSEYNNKVTSLNDIEIKRYKNKSPGFFAAASKNFSFLGFLALHGCLNYSLENGDKDKSVNFSIGAEKTIGGRLSIVAEYDFALNDNEKYSFGDGNGYLNAGLRWSAGDGFTVGIDLRDLFSNKKLAAGSADRAVRVEFIKPIF